MKMRNVFQKTICLMLILSMLSGMASAHIETREDVGERMPISIDNPWDAESMLPMPEGEITTNSGPYGWSERRTVVNTTFQSFRTIPSGQGPGFRFLNGGMIFINMGGGGSTTVTVSLAWGPATVTVSTGSAGTNISGVGVWSPASPHLVRAIITYTYRFERVRVEQFQFGQLRNTFYATNRVRTAAAPSVVRV